MREEEAPSRLTLVSLDHLVLTVRDVERTVRFYVGVLGMTVQTFRGNRVALAFGQQKINLHEAGKEFEPKAEVPTPGSADLCFLTETPILEVVRSLQAQGIPLVDGPVIKTGARGPILSVYIRDPDQNLIEIANLA